MDDTVLELDTALYLNSIPSRRTSTSRLASCGVGTSDGGGAGAVEDTDRKNCEVFS